MKKVFVVLFAMLLSMPAFNALALGDDGQLDRGFRGFVNVTTNFGVGDYSKDNYQLQCGFTGGYQINSRLFVGGGVDPTLSLYAYDDYHGDSSVDASFLLPIFSAIRFDVLDKKVTPFVEGRVGYYVNTDGVSESSGDVYVYGGTGVRLSRASLSLGYTYYGRGDYKGVNCIGLKFAFEF